MIEIIVGLLSLFTMIVPVVLHALDVREAARQKATDALIKEDVDITRRQLGNVGTVGMPPPDGRAKT